MVRHAAIFHSAVEVLCWISHVSALRESALADSKLPIGLDSFRTIREGGFHYVDKTGFVGQLISGGRRYFLSRPRRFGKSLLVDTFRELYQGREELFRGLAIHGDWDWSVSYPVIHLDFGGNYAEKDELENSISDMLGSIERAEGLATHSMTLNGRFRELIVNLRAKHGQPVVVLVDEYDRPILDAVRNPDVALRNRQILHGFYSALKNEDGSIRFCFVTGVTRFAYVSLFSGANHLRDITLKREYSSICGYTESDLDIFFSSEIDGLDRKKIRNWYNGYWWLGKEKVYNPFDILFALDDREFKSTWYETGAPTFLIDVLERRGVLPVALKDIILSEDELMVSELSSLSIGSLLLQTGYMTIVEESKYENASYYKLDFPNLEVRKSFNVSMLNSLLPFDPMTLSSNRRRLTDILEAGKVDDLENTLHAMFSGIPHQWHATPGAENYESYFASVVYGYFFGSSIDVRVEDATSEGRIDLTVVTSTSIYLFEFKVVNKRPTGKAMKQLRDKNYADKYRAHGRPIHLVAVEFSKKTRNIVDFGSEPAPPRPAA